MNMTQLLTAIGPNWWETGIGATIHDLMVFVAGILMVVAIVNLIMKGIKGEWAKGVKAIIGAFILSALLAYPQVVTSGINATKNLVQRAIDTISQADDGNGGGVSGPSTGNGN